jgi:hypothetical protein
MELLPGQTLVKKIVRKNPMAESKYKCSYSYSFVVDEVQGRDETVWMSGADMTWYDWLKIKLLIWLMKRNLIFESSNTLTDGQLQTAD